LFNFRVPKGEKVMMQKTDFMRDKNKFSRIFVNSI